MEITFLGTSGMVPTKERNVASVFLSYKNEGILFDCGEGTQRQMNIAGIKRNSVTKILITHWHGDHVGGIVGLLQTMGNVDIKLKVDLYGPEGTKKMMEHVLGSCLFELNINLKIHEIKCNQPVVFFEDEDFALQAAAMEHSVSCIGFAFIEKDRKNIKKDFLVKNGISEGKHLRELLEEKDIVYNDKKIKWEDVIKIEKGRKISYVTDTMYCSNAVEISRESDILICEAVYGSKLQKKAEQYKHMTAKSSAMIANQANVQQLVLTHFSQRYKNTQEVEDDARNYFDNVTCAVDFMKIKV
jgi:ribonuclease Z